MRWLLLAVLAACGPLSEREVLKVRTDNEASNKRSYDEALGHWHRDHSDLTPLATRDLELKDPDDHDPGDNAWRQASLPAGKRVAAPLTHGLGRDELFYADSASGELGPTATSRSCENIRSCTCARFTFRAVVSAAAAMPQANRCARRVYRRYT
jgi:hypothetical protein